MKKGFACGVFDLFHAGHVLMLKECKENCDYLIIALNKAENLPVGKNIPIYSFEERKLIIESIRYVDEVIGYNSEEELIELLKNGNISIRFLGDDYKNKPITGKDLVPIYFINRDHGLSSSKLRQKLKNDTK